MREHQPSVPQHIGPKWLGQGLTALALTLALATYLHATRSTVAATTSHSETAGLVSVAESAL